jgi:hypothetical protein
LLLPGLEDSLAISIRIENIFTLYPGESLGILYLRKKRTGMYKDIYFSNAFNIKNYKLNSAYL